MITALLNRFRTPLGPVCPRCGMRQEDRCTSVFHVLRDDNGVPYGERS